ncbi:hypothetical protein [Phascolarctobacterium sp.]|uniref:hypothetical protein n=1 Tax=Phascolarctobacterium sp. TaxID=2049039 RepID=UPI0025E5D7C7|nr:hypothetical protein [Phascolarctobacterium sp.]
MTMPSCPEAGQRAKLNRTCHSAQASLRSLLLEESCIRKKYKLDLNSQQKKFLLTFFQKKRHNIKNKFNFSTKEMNKKINPVITDRAKYLPKN